MRHVRAPEFLGAGAGLGAASVQYLPDKAQFHRLARQERRSPEYLKVDANTGEEVSSEDIVKGRKVDTDTCVEVSKDESEHAALAHHRNR